MPTLDRVHFTKVEHDEVNGWYRIHTDDAEIKRLDTKLAPLAREAADFKRSGDAASVQFTSKPRTLDDGRTFQNYYLDKIMPAASSNGSEDDGIERVAPTTRRTDPADAWRITLAASAKLAVASLPYLREEGYDISLPSIQRLSLAFAAFLFFTPTPADPRAARTEQQLSGYDPAPEPRTFGDDDIPFLKRTDAMPYTDPEHHTVGPYLWPAALAHPSVRPAVGATVST